jgi:hypothetical protein
VSENVSLRAALQGWDAVGQAKISPPVVKAIRKFCLPAVVTGHWLGSALQSRNEVCLPVWASRWNPAGTPPR